MNADVSVHEYQCYIKYICFSALTSGQHSCQYSTYKMLFQEKRAGPSVHTNRVFGKVCIGTHWCEGCFYVIPCCKMEVIKKHPYLCNTMKLEKFKRLKKNLRLFRKKQNLKKMNPEISLTVIIPFLALHAESITGISLWSLLFNQLCW